MRWYKQFTTSQHPLWIPLKKTNEYLRKRSYKVAKNSMHILGKAIDFSVPSLRMSQLARAVRNHAKGGAGVYDTFVHLDSGPKRGW